jgi:hypothetical protein
MKKAKHHFLLALAESAEESMEKAISKASGYATPEIMRADLAKNIFEHPELRRQIQIIHEKARAEIRKEKPRTADVRKKSGRGQASRLQPRGNER